MKKILELTLRPIKRVMSRMGFTVTRIGSNSNDNSLGYISAKKTVAGAKLEGLSICDYVEALWDNKGGTQYVIDQINECGIFLNKGLNVVEIGAGTGRYMEKVLKVCKPNLYESYETAKDWADYLQSAYPIISHPADGSSLRFTHDYSAGLIHAHGVFVYLPFLISYRYWEEIWRTTKIGGFVIFDIISEDCLQRDLIQKWLESNHSYPCFLSKSFTVSLFNSHGFSLVKTFTHRYGAGKSEYLVFLRKSLDKVA